MSASSAQRSEMPLGECRLDLAGLGAQRERYRRLGRQLEHARRVPQRLELRFTDELDRALLDETLAIERECCPFFALAYHATRRELAITVANPAQDPALDALRHALTGSP